MGLNIVDIYVVSCYSLFEGEVLLRVLLDFICWVSLLCKNIKIKEKLSNCLLVYLLNK